MYTLFTPPTMSVALSASHAHSVHSSYHVCCSLGIPCTLCSLLLPVSAALSTSLAHSVHSSYQCLLLSPIPRTLSSFCSVKCHSFSVAALSVFVCNRLLLCPSAAALLASITSCIVLSLSYKTCRVAFLVKLSKISQKTKDNSLI